MRFHLPMFRPRTAGAGRTQFGRFLRRRYLIGATGTGLLVLSLGVSSGGAAQRAAEEDSSPAAGHAHVVARFVADPSDDSMVWTLTELQAGEDPVEVGGDGRPGFLVGSGGAFVVRDETGAQAHLADGEALAVEPDLELAVQAAGDDPATVSFLALVSAASIDVNSAPSARASFDSPGGSREVELVADVVTEGETARIEAGEAATLVLVTAGEVAIVVDEDESTLVRAGETALVPGELIVTGVAADPSRFVAAVIGVDVDAEADAESATPPGRTPTGGGATPTPRSSPRPSPSPDPDSPTPTPVPPTPTPAGNGPDDDPDGDGLVNKDEETAGTDKHNPDTDGDLLKDGEEVQIYNTLPLVYDSDGDTLFDSSEVLTWGTNPLDSDSDDDGLNDSLDIHYGADPLSADTDADLLKDPDEVILGTDPRNADTDGDGLLDGDEVGTYGSNPLDADVDDDGAGDGLEVNFPTNPFSPDTDGDGFLDGREIHQDGTDPRDANSHA